MNFFIPSSETSPDQPFTSTSSSSSPIQNHDELHTKIGGKRSSSEENLDKKKKRQTNAEKGYEVCGQANKFKKPCQRVGVCPFHHKMGINSELDDRAIARKLKKESKKAKEQAANLNRINTSVLQKEGFEALLDPSKMNANVMFPVVPNPLQKCSSTSSLNSEIDPPSVSGNSFARKDDDDNFISNLWLQMEAFSEPPPTTEADLKDFKDPFEGLYPSFSFSVPAFNFNPYSQIA